mgnify:CR=1 FL=1
MKYYLHDSSAFEDEKVSELFINFGYEGVGLFYVILEKIAKQEKPVKTSVLKKQLRIGKRLEKCWDFMEEIELISSSNGETFNKQLLNFSEKYQIKNKKTAKRVSEWRERQAVEKNVTHNKRVRNAPKVNRSKVNESNNIILPFSSFEFSSAWNSLLSEPNWKNKTTNALTLSIKKLSKYDEATAIKMIEKAIECNWKGIYPIIDTVANNNKPLKQLQRIDRL